MKQNKVLSTQGDVRKNQMGFESIYAAIIFIILTLIILVSSISYFIHSLINKVVKIFKKQKGKDK
tara:strand:- start:342 stop:536 length:195 start_codon:yes stop_codon:yes gene_type:complete